MIILPIIFYYKTMTIYIKHKGILIYLHKFSNILYYILCFIFYTPGSAVQTIGELFP